MSRSRLPVSVVLALTAMFVCDPRIAARAQDGSGTTQTEGPDGSVSTTVKVLIGPTTQNITPQGDVIIQSMTADGRVITQNITPYGEVLSDDGLTAGRRAAKMPLSPATLRLGLDVCVWDATQRGPLLAVAPEAVFPAWQNVVRKPLATFDAPQSPELLPGGRYRVPDLADYFGYRTVRLRGLSVLAPREMVVLNTKLGKPAYFADLSPDEKLRMLQASLTVAQWKLLGSEEGLGANDLSGKQRELFVGSLPNPLVIVKPRVYDADGKSVGPSPKPIVLSGSQRDAVRLRFNRVVAQVGVPSPGGGKSFYISGNSFGADYVAMNYTTFESDGSKVFGQQVRRAVPNWLKPQQIDFASPALQKPVSLAGLKTVGDLVAQIRTATRVEIYVDGRMAKRSLWVRSGETQTIGAGDALQALCWSLTGAVRYVSNGQKQGGVFVLTDDLEGIGSRLALLKEWAQTAQERVNQARKALPEEIYKKQPLQYIGFAAGDPNALGEKANKAIEDGWRSPKGRGQGVSISLADLSMQQQKVVRQRIVSFNESGERPVRYDGQALTDTEAVTISVNIRPVFLVPGIGVVRDAGSLGVSPSGLIDTMQPPSAPVPPANSAGVSVEPVHVLQGVSGGTLCVSPATDEEARQAVRAAQERGLKQVWLVLPLVPAAADDSEASLAKSKALLSAAVNEAQKAKPPIKVLAGVRLFRLPKALPPDSIPPPDEQDVTITGELPSAMAKRRAANSVATPVDPVPTPPARQMMYDWAAPGAAGVTERIARRLSEIAATPRISGLALLDASPLGYSLPSTPPDEANPFRLPLQEDFASVGYNPLTRAAFIRSAGFDPIDITPDTFAGSVDLRLPFLDPDNSAIKSVTEWNGFRSTLISKALADLYVPLMASLPKSEGGFPVYLQNLDASSSTVIGRFSQWEKKDALPRQGPSKEVSSLSLLSVSPDAAIARRINADLTKNKSAWAGFVLNFSEVPISEALELLQENLSPATMR